MPQSTERKPPLMQEIEITLPSHSTNDENMDMREGRRNRRNNYDDYDLTRGAKQMDLDELYSDDYEFYKMAHEFFFQKRQKEVIAKGIY